MPLRLAHSSGEAPTTDQDYAVKKYVDDTASVGTGGYFTWNHTNASQFTLVDPGALGWTLTFVAATTSEPEHLQLRAPASWTTTAGQAFLITASDISVADFDLEVIHNFHATTLDSYLGPIFRYSDANNFMSVRWRQTPSSTPNAAVAVWQREGGVDTQLASDAELIPATDPNFISITHGWCMKNIVGGGWARPNMLVNYVPVDPSMLTKKKIGFGVFSLTKTGSGGNEVIKIYGIAAKAK